MILSPLSLVTMACYPYSMGQATLPRVDDDIREAVEEDERAALLDEFRSDD